MRTSGCSVVLVESQHKPGGPRVLPPVLAQVMRARLVKSEKGLA